MKKQEFTFSIFIENQVGLLLRILIIFYRRKINVESLNISPSEVEGIHRITIVINETEEIIKKIARQIQKQIEVIKVYFNTNKDILWQELALCKVLTGIVSEKVCVERLLRQYGANTVCIKKDYTIFTVAGHEDEVNLLVKTLEPYGLIEFIRSGRIAIVKSNEGFHKKLYELERKKPVEVSL